MGNGYYNRMWRVVHSLRRLMIRVALFGGKLPSFSQSIMGCSELYFVSRIVFDLYRWLACETEKHPQLSDKFSGKLGLVKLCPVFYWQMTL